MSNRVNTAVKVAGVAVLAAALASPALANPRFTALFATLRAQAQPLEPSGRLQISDRASFFALLGRDDPRSPN